MRRLTTALNDLVTLKIYNANNIIDETIKVKSHTISSVGYNSMNISIVY